MFSANLKQKAITTWEAGYNHPFVQEIGKGTLDKEKFKFYLIQDYHYLIEYAKVFALAAVKSSTEEMMIRFVNSQYSILIEEMKIHREYMASFGITPDEVQKSKPSLYNRTYTANMLAIGQTGDLSEMLATVFPCAWTYSDYAQRLKVDYADKLENNFYKSWILGYASDDFAGSFNWFFESLDKTSENKTAEGRARLEDIFISSVEFEYLFWDMSYKMEMSYKL